jgi:hypothetical protein
MYSATVQITIPSDQVFPPLGPTLDQTPSIAYTISAPLNSPPVTPSPGKKSFFSSPSENEILVSVPKHYRGWGELTFQLFSAEFVLVGVIFSTIDGGVAREEFPTFKLDRSPDTSQITIIDTCNRAFDKVKFRYIFVVQRVTKVAGEIVVGVIDPEIENEIVP